MVVRNKFASGNRFHLILIPGFGGFDALGQVEYYAGVTSLFRQWAIRSAVPAVLHYFDNLPTAAVKTRATRLRAYLAKRIVRVEIIEGDQVVLVGHSTGGLDIRQLISDLHDRPDDRVYADGGAFVRRMEIRERLDAVVFLSVPHWGTNIADWVRSHRSWRAALVAEMRAAVAGSQAYVVDAVEARLASGLASLADAELLLAARDALTEANAGYGVPGPSRTADAHEAASELALFLQHVCSDFGAIDDLACSHDDTGKRSPAHFDARERQSELERWRNPSIRTLTFATIGGRPYRFCLGKPAPVWKLAYPWTYPEIAKDPNLSAHTDLSYRVCYRACAGGPFAGPGRRSRVPKSIELWDNDGIVNTASMFWPEGDNVLVRGDHLDIVGHYKRVEVPRERNAGDKYQPARKYRSYDALRSTPQFTDEDFENVWNAIFEFAAEQAVRTTAVACTI